MVCSIERLLADTEHRILSSGCVDTSNEVKRDNIYLAKKNIKEINKLEGLFYAKEGRNVDDNIKVSFAAAQESLCALRARVEDLSVKVCGNDNWEVSSLDRSYDHIVHRL